MNKDRHEIHFEWASHDSHMVVPLVERRELLTRHRHVCDRDLRGTDASIQEQRLQGLRSVRINEMNGERVYGLEAVAIHTP